MPSGRFNLTTAEVAKARRLYREGMELAPLAKRFRVGVTTIQEAITGVSWKRIPDPVQLRRPVKSERFIQRTLRQIAREERT